MKAKSLTFFIFLFVAAFVVALGYIRFAPFDVARWHADTSSAFAPTSPTDLVVAQTGGATLRLSSTEGLLAKLDAIAMATPRTQRVAGSVASGRITWITRSALWGFPDYTTAEIRADGVYIHARLRFGKSDLGVNAARLTDWQSKL